MSRIPTLPLLLLLLLSKVFQSVVAADSLLVQFLKQRFLIEPQDEEEVAIGCRAENLLLATAGISDTIILICAF